MTNSLIEYLRAQPEDFVLNWYCDEMDADKPWDMTWVDVLFEDHLAWTISSGFFENDEGDLIWPPDMVAHMLVDPNRPDPYVGCIPVPLNEPPDDDAIKEIRWAQSMVGVGSYWIGAPAWSAAEVNRAIEDWCMRHVGRAIQARWDAEHEPSPAMAQAMEMMEAMKSGAEPKYLLSPGVNEGGTGYSVYASEQVMEQLLQSFAGDDDDD